MPSISGETSEKEAERYSKSTDFRWTYKSKKRSFGYPETPLLKPVNFNLETQTNCHRGCIDVEIFYFGCSTSR